MKNTLFTAFTILVVSCSSLTSIESIANQPTSNNHAKSYNSESSSLAYLISDAAITLSIKKQFLMDDKINSLNIKIFTTNGKVILIGTAPSKQAKEVAISIAKSTKGVVEVEANLAITDESLIKQASDDTIITSKIKIAYLNDPDINSSSINVKTVNECVILTGTVPDESTKEKAIAIARDTPSVKKVLANDVQVNKASFIKNIASDSAISSIIKLRYLEDDILSVLDIHVKTINQEVILSGAVQNNEEKEKAILIAKLTNGVKKVSSQLEVQQE